MSGWKPLVDAYMGSVAPSMESPAAAGFATKRQESDDLVRVQGTWMTLKAAAKAGLI